MASDESSSVSKPSDVSADSRKDQKWKSKDRDESPSRRKKRKKHRSRSKSERKHRRKRHRRDDESESDNDDDRSSSSSGSLSYSSYSSDESDRHKKKKHKHKKKHKKRKRDKKKKGKKSRKKSSKKTQDNIDDDGPPVFGKYGIIKVSDMHKERVQRSFQMWMEQVKGMPGFNGPKWEVQNYFKEYAEDYNTATLPHKKYYDYEKWEMDEYQKNKAKAETSASKEDEYLREQQERAKKKREGDLKSLMTKEKLEDMKRQKQLQSEMQAAFKLGDHERYQQLKKRLERED